MPPRLSLCVLRCPPRGLALFGTARRGGRMPPRVSLRVLCPPPRGLALFGVARHGGPMPPRLSIRAGHSCWMLPATQV
jgi:hypothetical protein